MDDKKEYKYVWKKVDGKNVLTLDPKYYSLFVKKAKLNHTLSKS